MLPDGHDEVDIYDVRDELKDRKKIEPTEVPIAISIVEVLDAHKVDPFCNEILSGNGMATGKFVETDYGVLRWIPPGEVDALQTVVP